MNKYVQYYQNIIEIRPDRTWRAFAILEPFKLLNQSWSDDVPFIDEGSWESDIKRGVAKIINIEQLVEENFEKLL